MGWILSIWLIQIPVFTPQVPPPNASLQLHLRHASCNTWTLWHRYHCCWHLHHHLQVQIPSHSDHQCLKIGLHAFGGSPVPSAIGSSSQSSLLFFSLLSHCDRHCVILTKSSKYIQFLPVPIDAWPFSHGSETHAHLFIGILTKAY